MFNSTQQFIRQLEAKINVPYEYTFIDAEHPIDRIIIKLKGVNMPPTPFYACFTGDGYIEGCDSVLFFCHDLIPGPIPQNKVPAMLEVVNRLNSGLTPGTNLFTFHISTNDNVLHISMVRNLPKHIIGNICYDLFYEFIRTCDEIYPELMNALYR